MKAAFLTIGFITAKSVHESTRLTYMEDHRKKGVELLEKLGVEVVIDEWIYDDDTVRKAGAKLRQSELDAIVLWVVAWHGVRIDTVKMNNEFPDLPLIVWTSLRGDYPLCGFFELTNDFSEFGRKFVPVIGTHEAELNKMKTYLKAAEVVRKMFSTRVGQIGLPPSSFVDTTTDTLSYRRRLGIDVVHISEAEVIKEFREVDEKDARKVVAEYKGKVGEERIYASEEDFLNSAKLGVALEKVVGRHKLDGYSTRCNPDFTAQCGSPPCLGVSTLSDKGVPGAGHGDLPIAVTSVIMKEFASSTPNCYDVNDGMVEENFLTICHCSQIGLRLAHDLKEVSTRTYTRGRGVQMDFPLKPGRVTFAKLDQRAESMIVGTGEVVYPPIDTEASASGGYMEIKLDSDLVKCCEVWARNRLTHHVACAYGDFKSELEAFCELTGIKYVTC